MEDIGNIANSNTKKRKLTQEEKDERKAAKKRQSEDAREKKKQELAKLKAGCKLDPLPQRKFVNINDKQLFQCTYTGIPCSQAYVLPLLSRDNDGDMVVKPETKGCFINPSVALAWIEETQTQEVSLTYSLFISSDVTLRQGSLVMSPKYTELQTFGGKMSISDYLGSCNEEFSSNGNFYKHVDEIQQENKKPKSEKKPSANGSHPKPKLLIFDGINMETHAGSEVQAFVAVPINPQKVKDQLLKGVPDKLDTIPLLRKCKETKQGLVVFCADRSQKDEVQAFRKWVNEKHKLIQK
jgi:hypothetical protein